MGSHNPGRFRREGREDFEPGVDPEDVCPYNSDSFWDKSHKGHWLEGWKEAEAAYVEPEETTEYWVTARFHDECDVLVGELELPTIHTCHDMPTELEIDGVTYKPEF